MKNQLNFLVCTLLLLAIGLACGSKTPPPAQYVGTWTGSDGSEITIRADGSGDYKSGNSSVSGGSVTIDESGKSLKITMLSMGPTYTIDKPPAGDQMTLSGVVFRKGGGTNVKTDEPSSKTTSSGDDIPPEDELQDLARQTILDFNSAIQSDDFSDFHATLAEPFKKEVSAEKLAGVFHEFVKAKPDFSSVSNLDATFTTPPAMVEQAGHDMLRLKGNYATKPRRTNFELKYIYEDGSWKLSHIDINTK
jgi:hypothetical protein